MAEQIRLIEEDQAQGSIRVVYSDIKRTMSVPLVGDVFRALAVFPSFLDVAWSEIKPVVGTASFEGLADRLRAHALACARQRFYVPDHAKALKEAGLDDGRIALIRNTAELFFQTDPRLLVIASALRSSMATGAVGVAIRTGIERRERVPSPLLTPPGLVSAVQPPPGVTQVFDEVMATFGVPLVPSDFRSLARWPAYLRQAWSDVKGQLRTAEFRRHVGEINDIAKAGVRDLPVPVRVGTMAVRIAGVDEGQLRQVQHILAQFEKLLPNLVGTVSLLRLGLNALMEHALLEMEAS